MVCDLNYGGLGLIVVHPGRFLSGKYSLSALGYQ
jgi:hypothetical protein